MWHIEDTELLAGPDISPSSTPLEVARVATTSALVCVIGVDGRILLFNPALEHATGWASEDVVGRLFWEVLVVPHEVELARDSIERAIATGHAPPQEGDWLDRWGGHRRVSMQNAVLLDDQDRPFAMACIGFDVTRQRLLESQLRERAASDALTGLRNRTALLAALRAELADESTTGCGLLFCDLDGFKLANDTHGHPVGDMLLCEVANRLLGATTSDEVVARFGGDEFVVLCRRADEHRVAWVREQINEAIHRPFLTPHGLVQLGVSVGTAIGRPGDAGDDLLAAADRHMYGVKTQRRAVAGRLSA